MTPSQILIVEDEPVVAEDIRRTLQKAGHEIAGIVETGEEALERARRQAPDLVLMDIRLAGAMDGTEAAAALVRRYEVPIVFLTAYTGADVLERAKASVPFGYVVKPFTRGELLCAVDAALVRHARESALRADMQALSEENDRLRERMLAVSGDRLRVLGHGFVFDQANACLLHQGEPVSLTKKETRFVWLLAENMGRTIPYSRIETHVWGEQGVLENTLRIFVWRLRRKIGKELIRNVVGVGYCIDAPAAAYAGASEE